MFGFNPYVLLGAVVGALALFGVGTWTGHKVTHNAWMAEQAELQREAVESYKADVERMNRLGREQVAREQEKERDAQLLQRALTKVVERPVYRDRACALDDDGLRLLNAAIAGESPDRPELHGAVRAGNAADGAGNGASDPEGAGSRPTPQQMR